MVDTTEQMKKELDEISARFDWIEAKLAVIKAELARLDRS